MLKNIPLLTLLLLSASCATHAQMADSERTLHINMTSTNQVPADLLVFTININAEGETPREVYELHKQRESLLAKLLNDMEVKDEEISFQPVSFSTRSQGRNMDAVSVSMQQVTVRFTDFDLYEELQITLISNGFDQLRAQFSSTEIEAAKQQALADAIAEAKKKAEFIAKESGVELAEIQSMNYSDQVMQPFKRSMDEVVVSGYSSAPSMMDFSPTLSVGASVSITFAIK